MDEQYDAIVLGTGLTECIISGLLSVAGKKARPRATRMRCGLGAPAPACAASRRAWSRSSRGSGRRVRRAACRAALRKGLRVALLCRAAALLSTRGGAQVLHMDRNNYYGGESASYNLTQARVWARAARAFAPPQALPGRALRRNPRTPPARAAVGEVQARRGGAQGHGPPQRVQRGRGAPSRVAHSAALQPHAPSAGAQVHHGQRQDGADAHPHRRGTRPARRMRLCTHERSRRALCAQVKYLEFKAVDGSFVVRDKRVHKVPANDMEALRSPLMGMFEKRRARSFFIYVQDYNEQDQRTWQARMPARRSARRSTHASCFL